MKSKISVMLIAFILFACSPKEQVLVLSTLPDTNKLLVEKTTQFSHSNSAYDDIIKINTEETFQSVLGVGAALTHASAWVFQNNLSKEKRDSLFKVLFTPEGVGINYTRLCVGASDFSFDLFSYSDTEDFTLSNFSIEEDYKSVIPMLKEILAVNPELQIMATPWSPPAWMKTNGSMIGGKLKTDCYGVYADYLIKYIEAYKKEGITIHTMTVQNEPEFGTAAYPCMDMTVDEQKVFIRDFFGPKLHATGLPTKIVLFDHNCDNPNYPISIMNDDEAKKWIDGSGFHLYKGNINALCDVYEAHPDRNIYFTEQSGGGWAPDFDQNVRWYVGELMIGAMNCWSKNVLLWNLALDENNGPKNFGCQDCYGVVEINKNGEIKKHGEYYALTHYGKFVEMGAMRLTSESNDIKGVAFKNPDNSIVYIAVNYGEEKNVQIETSKSKFNYTFRKGEVASFKWKE
jgi:glucosylceramidase